MVPLIGVTANGSPLHVVKLIGETVAEGEMVTTTVNEAPTPQLTVVGVTK